MDIESQNQKDSNKRTDLLETNLDDLDIGFKIKKKKKQVNEEDENLKNRNIINSQISNDKLKYIKVDEMNVIKVKKSKKLTFRFITILSKRHLKRTTFSRSFVQLSL